jgi:NADH-quinone oxidoreductase subunit M
VLYRLFSVLNLIVLVPIIAAVLVLLGAPARKTAFGAAIIQAVVALLALLSYDKGGPQFQFAQWSVLVPEWDLKYFLAADGLSLVMLLLTGLVTLAAIWVTPTDEKRPNLFYACLLLISGGAAGAFASQDLFFFYSFHELALIPTFLLIGIWGTGERQATAWKITIYLALGSFVLLIGLADLYLAIPEKVRTFDMVKLQDLARQNVIPAAAQNRPYLFLLLGFGTLVSLFPFHSWAPGAYASAPTPAAMLHAGVLKKFGVYGLIRVAVPLLPAGAQHWANLLLVLLIGNIIYIGLVTIAQRRLDLMLGYSSVMHMGYIFLGIGALNVIGVSGAALLMFAHGLSIAALFALAGILRQRSESLAFENFGGLGKVAPFLGAAFGCAAFASIGLPGFANFASEIMVFFGAFKPGVNEALFGNYRIATGFALWGVVISAVYMLRAYKQIFMGEPSKSVSSWTDVVGAARFPVLLLIAVLMITGFAPSTVLNYVKPSVEALVPVQPVLK